MFQYDYIYCFFQIACYCFAIEKHTFKHWICSILEAQLCLLHLALRNALLICIFIELDFCLRPNLSCLFKSC